MPELPEVETVRRGLESTLSGRQVVAVQVLHPRAVRRHSGGADDFAARLTGNRLGSAMRRGKYLWIPLADGDAMVAHLGMSGQFRIHQAGLDQDAGPHVRAQIQLDDDQELDFVDQRTFGGLAIEPVDSEGIPISVQHIALDPFDKDYDLSAAVSRLRRCDTEVKRALLDQTVVSGVGNIYADEALWRAKIHPARGTRRLTRVQVERLLQLAGEVMTDSLSAGGTSFDDLYVNVNGESGYFERSLDVYGREGEPCERCGGPIRRMAFMNRSSYFCPRCQRGPRRVSTAS